MHKIRSQFYFALWALIFAHAAFAQVLLPDVNVTGKAEGRRYGGYLISGDFQVDKKMSAVIFPSVPLEEGDVLSVQPVRMNDDEYLVLQECSQADCTQAHVLRVWGAFGATTEFHDPNRLMIAHEGKYFLWMQKIEAGAAPAPARKWFDQFAGFSPPLTLVPEGNLVAYSAQQLLDAQSRGPMQVRESHIDADTFIATFDSGTVVRIKRMHAAK